MLLMENYPAKLTKKTEQAEQIPSEELLKLQSMLQGLKDRAAYSKNPSEYKELCGQTYKDLAGFFINSGAEFVTDVNDIYKEYGGENKKPFIVRREDPEKVVALSEGFDISLSFDPKVVGDRGDKYVNCAIWPYGRDAVSGIKNAFLEGRGMAGPIVSLIATKQNLENNTVEEATDAMLRVGTIDRDAVRIVSGKITKEDLRFIILRIQKDFFPDENLVDAERDEKVKQIFRGFTF